MPTLLQINVCVNRGSTGRIAEQIGEAVMSRGWSSYIAYGRGDSHSTSHTIKIGSRLGVALHALLTRITDRHGLYSRIATKRLIRQIESIAPDIIHLHNIHGYYINYQVLFSYLREAKIPVVWTLHDCWAMTGHCSHFEYVGCARWKTGCYDCPQKNAYPRSWLMDNSRNNYSEKCSQFTSIENLTLVPVSDWLGAVAKESNLGEYNIRVIHNGIDTCVFTPVANNTLRQQYGISDDKKIVLGVASPWSKQKGFNDFIKLNEHLSKQRYQIVMVGISEGQRRKLPNSIIGIPRTSDIYELVGWYSAADVFVNPTFEDSYPTTNLEALSCGTPVITYKTGGSSESVNSDMGRVVDKGRVEGLAEAIEELCKENRAAMREKCRAYAVAHFDKRDCFREYIDLYEEILQKR